MAAIRATGPDDSPTVERKADHIRINLEQDVRSKGITSGFERYRFIHRALPEVDLDAVDLSVSVLGRRLAAPLLISCMTGGVPEAGRINATLARVAEATGIAIGVGSGRVLLENPEVLPTFRIRPLAPNALILANLGAVQLNRGIGAEQCRKLVDLIQADALVLHLNALQEALQAEGDTTFAGLLEQISRLCRSIDVPVIVKEVGWGVAADLVPQLLDAGVSAIDVAGAGGTSWSEVERHRMDDRIRSRVAAAFAGWGVPTAEAVRGARLAAPHALIFASGGIRDGMDVAKAIALGADLVGVAGPFLRAAASGLDEARDLATEFVEVLRTVMFCTGASTVGELQGSQRLVKDGGGLTTFTESIQLTTEDSGHFIDITDAVAAVVTRSGVQHGTVTVFSNHTTASIRVNENEPLLISDFRRLLDRLAPAGGYEHDELDRRIGIPDDEPVNGHAHCRHLLLSSSETIPVIGGQLSLGTWQRVFLIELCSARERTVTVQVVGA